MGYQIPLLLWWLVNHWPQYMLCTFSLQQASQSCLNHCNDLRPLFLQFWRRCKFLDVADSGLSTRTTKTCIGILHVYGRNLDWIFFSPECLPIFGFCPPTPFHYLFVLFQRKKVHNLIYCSRAPIFIYGSWVAIYRKRESSVITEKLPRYTWLKQAETTEWRFKRRAKQFQLLLYRLFVVKTFIVSSSLLFLQFSNSFCVQISVMSQSSLPLLLSPLPEGLHRGLLSRYPAVPACRLFASRVAIPAVVSAQF